MVTINLEQLEDFEETQKHGFLKSIFSNNMPKFIIYLNNPVILRDINFKFGRSQLSCLHYAAFYNCIDMIDLLIEKGAILESYTLSNQTPLHFAVVGKQPAQVKKLLDLGADPDALDCYQKSPFDYAREPDIVKCFFIENSRERMPRRCTM